MDEPAPQVTPGGASTVLWLTDRVPASNAGQEDTAPGGVRNPIPPPRGGTLCRIVEFEPAADLWFHKTDTLDYAVVLEGEVWAVLDEAETLLKPGDVLIQRGTHHAWDNRSEQVCRILFVLIDAEPL
jgi:quercetin dioxygenase-like cupin family protein